MSKQEVRELADRLAALERRVAALEAASPAPRPEPAPKPRPKPHAAPAPAPRAGSIFERPGVFVADEVARSGDPPRAAGEVAARLAAEGIAWCAFQLHPGDDRQPANEPHAAALRAACEAHGVRFGTWAQGLPFAQELALLEAYGATFHVANPETRAEERAFDVAAYRRAHPDQEAAVVFLQPAFESTPGVPDPELARRWREAGFFAIPEANLAENPDGGQPFRAFDLAQNRLGWEPARIGPCLFVFGEHRATLYQPELGTSRIPRWSVWRYGGLTEADWATLRGWPRGG